MTLTALHTPGHTPGCTSWAFKVQEGGRTYDVLIIGSGLAIAFHERRTSLKRRPTS